MEIARQLIAVPDGRDVEIITAGPADGLPFIQHEGTPSGLHIYPPVAEAAQIRGLRLVVIARPGYEGSTPKPGRRAGDIAADVAAVLDELGADTFVTAGHSGGGPHALACAALLPGRCLAAASVAGVAPYGVAGLDWLAGMAEENVEELGAAVRGPAALSEFLERAAPEMAGVTGEQVAQAFGSLVSAVDVAALTGEYADSMAASLRASVSHGIAGWRDDDLAFVSDWGFTLGWDSPLGVGNLLGADPPAAPVSVWQGDQDRMVPFAHGEWLASHIPGARAHLLRGQGHLTITVTAIGEVLDDLLDRAGITSS
jgi:pimeloyl-ACP methyl ester carboxylesterase